MTMTSSSIWLWIGLISIYSMTMGCCDDGRTRPACRIIEQVPRALGSHTTNESTANGNNVDEWKWRRMAVVRDGQYDCRHGDNSTAAMTAMECRNQTGCYIWCSQLSLQCGQEQVDVLPITYVQSMNIWQL